MKTADEDVVPFAGPFTPGFLYILNDQGQLISKTRSVESYFGGAAERKKIEKAYNEGYLDGLMKAARCSPECQCHQEQS